MSSDITRFNHVTDWGMERDEDGDYVLHSDHEAEVARLRADLEGYMMGAAAEAREVDARGEEIKRLRAELQNAAKAALDAVALSCEKEREADALRVDAERWQHARKLLSVDDIAECQRTLEEWNFLISEDECKRADEAIDAAMGASA